MARTKTIEGQALWQPGGANEDSRFCEGNGYLRLVFKEEEEELNKNHPLLKGQAQYLSEHHRGYWMNSNFF